MALSPQLISAAAIYYVCADLNAEGYCATKVDNMPGWHVQTLIDGEQVNIEVRSTSRIVENEDYGGKPHFVFQTYGEDAKRNRRSIAANRDLVAFVYAGPHDAVRIGWRPYSQSKQRVIKFPVSSEPKTRRRKARVSLSDNTFQEALEMLFRDLAA